LRAAAPAWAYLWWLADDMEMGGMDMSGFRMIPAGMGLMMPATAPWNAIELAFVFAMWAVMMIGMMTPSAAPMSDERSPPGMGRTALKADGSICASEPYDDAQRGHRAAAFGQHDRPGPMGDAAPTREFVTQIFVQRDQPAHCVSLRHGRAVRLPC
jgi:hypothetical protein